VTLVLKGRKDLRARKALPLLFQVHRVTQDHRDQRDLKERRVLREPQEPRVRLVLKGLRVHKV